MAHTVKQLIQSCLPEVGLAMDPVQDEMRDIGITQYNFQGKPIFDAWPWDNSKIPEFTATSDANKIITFASTVDVVRFVREATADDAGNTTPIFNRDEILARARGGGNDLGENFEHMADDSSGNRRIMVPKASTNYKVLALLRFVEVTSSTWTTLKFPIDRAEPALREFILDALRIFVGSPPQDRGNKLLQVALGREVEHSQRERKVEPRQGGFQEVGNW